MKRHWFWYAIGAFILGAAIGNLLDVISTARVDSDAVSQSLKREPEARFLEWIQLDDGGRGNDIAHQAVDAHASKAALESIGELRKVSETRILSSGDGEKTVHKTVLYKRGGKIRIDETVHFVTKAFLPQFNSSRAFDGDHAWIRTAQEARDVSDEELQSDIKELRGPAEVLREALGKRRPIRHLGLKPMQGKQCDVVALLDGESKKLLSTVFVDSASHLIAGQERIIELGGNLSGVYAKQQITYSQYRDTPIGKIPFEVDDTIRCPRYTEDTATVVVSLEVDARIDDDVFKKP